ncbi:MAG: endolytic transglycosylase MltG [Pseudorhodoplanes sp.]
MMDQKPIAPRSPRAALEPERVQMPTRRSKRVRHPLVIFGNAVFTFLVLLAIVVGGGFFWAKQRYEAPGPLQEEKVVNIPKGGAREIADLLVREGVINQPLIFVGAALAMKPRDLKQGEYQFPKQVSLRDAIEMMIENKVVQRQITIPEGLTSEQIVQRLLDSDILEGNIKEIPREGTLLPETYRVARGYQREDLLKRMGEAHRQRLQEIWDRRMPDLPVRTPQQLVVLASIIEKETGRADERTRVAAVFINRLKQRMKLQSDPTIIYGLVGGKGSLGRPIMRSEIDQPTPYNTYVIDGLPPGPIANPGRASLEAAANPARTKEIYFVADGTGGHAFAETYEQHQKNVARLRGIEKDQRDSAAANAASNAAPGPAVIPSAPAAATNAAPTTGARPPAPRPAPPRRQPTAQQTPAGQNPPAASTAQ